MQQTTVLFPPLADASDAPSRPGRTHSQLIDGSTNHWADQDRGDGGRQQDKTRPGPERKTTVVVELQALKAVLHAGFVVLAAFVFLRLSRRPVDLVCAGLAASYVVTLALVAVSAYG